MRTQVEVLIFSSVYIMANNALKIVMSSPHIYGHQLAEMSRLAKNYHQLARNLERHPNKLHKLSNGQLLRFYEARPANRTVINRNAVLRGRIELARHLRNVFRRYNVVRKRLSKARQYNERVQANLNLRRARNNITRMFHIPVGHALHENEISRILGHYRNLIGGLGRSYYGF